MARPSPSCAHDDDRLRLPPASPPSSNSAEKKESTGPRLSQLCPPCATPFSNSSLDYRRSDARIVENGFAASSGVSKSAKVVLAINAARPAGIPQPVETGGSARAIDAVRIVGVGVEITPIPILVRVRSEVRAGRLRCSLRR